MRSRGFSPVLTQKNPLSAIPAEAVLLWLIGKLQIAEFPYWFLAETAPGLVANNHKETAVSQLDHTVAGPEERPGEEVPKSLTNADILTPYAHDGV